MLLLVLLAALLAVQERVSMMLPDTVMPQTLAAACACQMG
jgi:hypothetical protein